MPEHAVLPGVLIDRYRRDLGFVRRACLRESSEGAFDRHRIAAGIDVVAHLCVTVARVRQ